MKKIIMGIVAATLATSVFAADVSAKVKLTGDLVNFNGKDFTALKINNHQSHDWEPDMALSVSSEKAGATVKFKTMNEWGSGEGETSTAWNIWFKPLDMLKLNIGIFDGNVNQEQIDWSNTKSNFGGNGGYGINLAVGPVSADVAVFPGMGNAWLANSAATGSLRMADTVLKVDFNSDFGKIGGLFLYKGNNSVVEKTTVYTGDVEYVFDKETGRSVAKQVTKEVVKTQYDYNYMKFALGYNSNSLLSNIAGLNVFVNVIGAVNSKGLDVSAQQFNNGLSAIRAEVWAKMNISAFSLAVFPAVNLSLVESDANKLGILTILKASYNFSNGMGAYVYMKAADWCNIGADGIVIRPGMTGSVGICGWEVKVEITVGKESAPFTLAVPVEFTVNF